MDTDTGSGLLHVSTFRLALGFVTLVCLGTQGGELERGPFLLKDLNTGPLPPNREYVGPEHRATGCEPSFLSVEEDPDTGNPKAVIVDYGSFGKEAWAWDGAGELGGLLYRSESRSESYFGATCSSNGTFRGWDICPPLQNLCP